MDPTLFVDLVRQGGHQAALTRFEQLQVEVGGDELEQSHLRSALAGAARQLFDEKPLAAAELQAALRQLSLDEAAERVRQRMDDFLRQVSLADKVHELIEASLPERLSTSELSRRLGVKHADIVRAVGQLERRGQAGPI